MIAHMTSIPHLHVWEQLAVALTIIIACAVALRGTR